MEVKEIFYTNRSTNKGPYHDQTYIMALDGLPIPDLCTIEKGWLGATSADAHPVPSGMPHGFSCRLIVEPSIITKGELYFIKTYALCNATEQIICFTGKDKLGVERRVFDVLSFHPPSRPDDAIIEDYNPDYVKLLSIRAKYHGEYEELIKKSDHSSSEDEYGCRIVTDRETNIQKHKIEGKRRNWLNNEIVTYMNRYFCLISDTKDYVIMKRIKHVLVGIKDHSSYILTPSLKNLTCDVFIRDYGNLSLPGEKISKMWLGHERRFSCNEVVFSEHTKAKAFNLWHGLRSIQQATNADDALPVFQHLREVFCCGNMELFVYVVRYLAHLVQYPLKRTNICFAMKGVQGSGKTFVFDGIMSHIFGEYYVNARVEHFERFDMFLAKAIILFLDETLDNWERKVVAKIKTLITSDKLRLEEKFLPHTVFDNHLNIVSCTNYLHSASVEHDDRRYLLINTSDHRATPSKENAEYWKVLLAVPPAAVHKALLEIDLTGFDLKAIPITDATRQQKELTLEPPAAWFLTILRDGSDIFESGSQYRKSDFYNQYAVWHKINEPQRKQYNATRFWILLREILGDRYDDKRPGSTQYRAVYILLPSLESCRVAFCKYMRDPEFLSAITDD